MAEPRRCDLDSFYREKYMLQSIEVTNLMFHCDSCNAELPLTALHPDEGDSLLCDDCFLKMMNETHGTDYQSLQETGYWVD